MSRHVLFLALALTSSTAFAQAPPDSVFQHPVAVEHPGLAVVTARMRQTPVLRANFEQDKRIKALRRPLRSSGQFLVAAETGVWWHTLAPFKSTFVITPKGLRQESADGVVKTLEASEQPVISGFTKVFMSLFGGDSKALQDKFKLYFEGDAKAWRVGLEPRSKVMGKLIQSIVLEGGDHIERIHFLEASGDLTLIKFNDVQVAPTSLSAEERRRFVF